MWAFDYITVLLLYVNLNNMVSCLGFPLGLWFFKGPHKTEMSLNIIQAKLLHREFSVWVEEVSIVRPFYVKHPTKKGQRGRMLAVV